MLSWIADLLLNFVWGKIVAFVTKTIAFFQRKKVIEKESEDSVKPLEDAKTADEIDKASDSALSGF